jgi:hypothetical protein
MRTGVCDARFELAQSNLHNFQNLEESVDIRIRKELKRHIFCVSLMGLSVARALRDFGDKTTHDRKRPTTAMV